MERGQAMTLEINHFDLFFNELWNCDPFPWQCRLSRQVCDGGAWPAFIELPTASGKTACLDIAVFALAVQAHRPHSQRTIGRRVFFVVNRRVIVDEAHGRARKIARKLRDAQPGSVLHAVAGALRDLSGDPEAPPLDVAILRGGIYRDNRWARSITQPTIITSTIDQVGSRLLFRGYGVSDAARPLHAALVAHDSLILLDEAHISQPFAQTLDAVRRYRGEAWASAPIPTPFSIVQMTATPGGDATDVFWLDDRDRAHPVLNARRNAAKRVNLHIARKATGKNALDELAKVVADKAEDLLDEQRRTIAVIVNRVATARKVHEILKRSQADNAEIHLAIGRMRPLDRDDLTVAIQSRVGKTRRDEAADKPLFVIATQCLEVGADFDFDAMVSECASLDALRQRFGRLNRTGRNIDAQGCIIIRADQQTIDENNADPIYGSALAATWQRLGSIKQNETVDFGIAAMETALNGVDPAPLLAPRTDAPVLFPAYVDAWAQTSPAPAPDSDVSLFLHGPQRGEPDVQVCWRADLPGDDPQSWAEIISLCPPSSSECMSVPIGLVRAWFAHNKDNDDQRGDTLDAAIPEEEQQGRNGQPARAALIWRGLSQSRNISAPDDLRPGDTLILPVAYGGWALFGHIPNAPSNPTKDTDGIDLAERAFRQSKGRVLLRLTPARLASWPACEAREALKAWLDDSETDLTKPALRQILKQIADAAPDSFAGEADALRLLANPSNGLTVERYPGKHKGAVLTTLRRISRDDGSIPAMDDGEDEPSRISRQNSVSLEEHAAHVRATLESALPLLPVEAWAEALCAAAILHDLGKADERFQALLLGGNLDDAWAQTTLWAKSARMPASLAQRRAAWRRSGLPQGFRHEMLSTQLAEASLGLPDAPLLRDLALHLIAAHHGHARPFAPVVLDPEPPDVVLPDSGPALTGRQRADRPMHRLDSGVAERFWTLARHFGWWGLAYLEAVLRLSDQRASQREDQEAPFVSDANTGEIRP